MTELVAIQGVRGATVRRVADRAGITLAALVRTFGGKPRLLAAALDHALAEEMARFDRLRRVMLDLAPGEGDRGALLWSLTPPTSDSARQLQLVLAEMLLQSADLPELRIVCRRWIARRRDLFRAMIGPGGDRRDRADLLMLAQLAEELFAPACADSFAWQLVAATGFAEMGAALGLWPPQGETADRMRVAERFHANPASAPAEAEANGSARAAILSAAASIVADHGIAAITHRAVARRAACSLAATTYHFGSIADLIEAAVLEVFRKSRSAGTGGRLKLGPGGIRAWIAGRDAPSLSERLGTRAMAEIALASARGQVARERALAIRRHRGTITHGRLQALGHPVDRLRTVAAANWFTGVYLVSAAQIGADELFDFDRQADLVGECVLGTG
jgi:DNA-binding transcriptional regulator YbjK